jgi:hypothetical protein
MSLIAVSVFALLAFSQDSGAAEAAATASPQVSVEVGRFDPDSFPDLIRLERTLPHAEMTRRVRNILAERQCSFEGQSDLRFDITVPYAALLNSEGEASRVVVKDMGCVPLETLVGRIVLAQFDRGDFKVRHETGERWYSSELYFAQGEPVRAAMVEDKDKIVCKREDQPMLGTRLKFKKTCKTVAEWQAYDHDREQLRRDIRNSGACAGNPSCSFGG